MEREGQGPPFVDTAPRFVASSASSPYTPDRFGEEMADDARVWRIYAHEATKFDDLNIRTWNASLDSLLIFAGLFSAVATAFTIESYKLMLPDYTQLAYFALIKNISTPHDRGTFQISGEARTINCLWISSLIISLSTALLCILAKQWLALFVLPVGDSLREWAASRQYRYDGLVSWRLPGIIASLPMMLHAALLLFLAGMIVFLHMIEPVTTLLALTLGACISAVYVATSLSPVFWPESPFRTHFTSVMERAAHRIRRFIRRRSQQHRSPPEGDDVYHRLIANAVSWLGTAVSSREAFAASVAALGDMRIGSQVALLTTKKFSVRILLDMHRLDATRLDTQSLTRFVRATIKLGLDTFSFPRSLFRPTDVHSARTLTRAYISTFVARQDGCRDSTVLCYCFLATDQDALLAALQPILPHSISTYTISHAVSTLLRLKADTGGSQRRRLSHLLNIVHAWIAYCSVYPRQIVLLLHEAFRPYPLAGGDFPMASSYGLCSLLEALARSLASPRTLSRGECHPTAMSNQDDDLPPVRPLLRTQVIEDIIFLCKAGGAMCVCPRHTALLQLLLHEANFTTRSWAPSELALLLRHCWPESDELPLGPQKSALLATGVITLLQPLSWNSRENYPNDDDQLIIFQACRRIIVRCVSVADAETLHIAVGGLQALSMLSTSNIWLSTFVLALAKSIRSVYAHERDVPSPHSPVLQLVRVLASSNAGNAALIISATSRPSDVERVWDFAHLCVKVISRSRELPSILDMLHALLILQRIAPAIPVWRKIAIMIHRDFTLRQRPESLVNRARTHGNHPEARAITMKGEVQRVITSFNEAIGCSAELTALTLATHRNVPTLPTDLHDRLAALHATLRKSLPEEPSSKGSGLNSRKQLARGRPRAASMGRPIQEDPQHLETSRPWKLIHALDLPPPTLNLNSNEQIVSAGDFGIAC